ncbi:MAG: tetratricopeptide repeat protein [Taibaiella sp.]|nr:tetratricopeptide repeat protein [Taibaiella sp.]
MKSAFLKYMPVFAVVMLFASCKNTSKPKDDDPVYNSDPRLSEVTSRIRKNPENAELYFERAKMLYKLKLDTLAIRDFKAASSLDTGNASYYSAVGDVLFEAKDIAGSVEWLEKAIRKNPDDPKAHLKMAKMFLFTQDYPKAFEQINIVLRKNVYNPEAYFLKGMVYKDMKDTVKAISSFQTALQVVPDYKEAVVQLGLIYSAKNDPTAIKYLDNAYRMDSSDVFPVFARGVYYQNNNDYPQAKEEYKKCIRRNTHYIDAYFNLGYIYLQQDSVEKAFRQYDLVTKLQPDNPSGYYNRGICNEMMKNLKDAVVDYRRALLLDTSYSSPKAALKRLSLTK